MSKAGCRYLAIGVESGSNEILSRIQKEITIDQVFDLVEEAGRVNIKPNCYFMFSHLGETIRHAMETVQCIGKLMAKYGVASALQPCMILPGAQLEALAKKKGCLPKKFSWSTPYLSQQNIRLGQFASIPLFIDSLTVDEMHLVLQEYSTILEHNAVLEQKIKKYIFEKYISALWPTRFANIIAKRGLRGIFGIVFQDISILKKARNAEKKFQKMRNE
jgi:hypothetical protein